MAKKTGGETNNATKLTTESVTKSKQTSNEIQLFDQLQKLAKPQLISLYEEACTISTRARHETSLSPIITYDSQSGVVTIEWLSQGPRCKLEGDRIVIEYPRNEINFSKEKSSVNEVFEKLVEWLNFEVLNGSTPLEPTSERGVSNTANNIDSSKSDNVNDGLVIKQEEKAAENLFVNFTFH
jgi:hypothetical protein